MKKTTIYRIKFLGHAFSVEFHLLRPPLREAITAALKKMAEAEEITADQYQCCLDLLLLAPAAGAARTNCTTAGVYVGCIYVEPINAFA